MNTQAMIIIGSLLLVIVLSNTAQTILYNKLRKRYDSLRNEYFDRRLALNLEIDQLRKKLWLKENKNAPNPTLDIHQAGRFDPVVYEKLRTGEPDPRD